MLALPPHLDPIAVAGILEFLDHHFFPNHLADIWLTGSRARGDARPDSDYDVVIFLDEANPIPSAAKGPEHYFSMKEVAPGLLLDALVVRRTDWEHPGQFMCDFRRDAVRIR